jgi:hypothetical protein
MFSQSRLCFSAAFLVIALLLPAYAYAQPDSEAAQAAPADPGDQAAAVAPQEAGQLAPGDLAVTGFSGARLPAQGVAPGVDPLEKTVINVDEPSLRVFDLTALGAAPGGQVINPAVKLAVPARDIGQVFGVAIDAPADGAVANLFAAATSIYGLNIVAREADKDGVPVRLRAGATGANFMAGQFGGLPGAGPGTIFKIDGSTGAASVFAATDVNGVGNSGAGLAALAVDSEHRSLFVADLDTGLIHRFDLDAGAASTAQFDHGAVRQPAVPDDGVRLDLASPSFDPGNTSTWGMTAAERRVTGLAVHDARLFYAVASGPEVWSVAINADGTFGTDPRLETAVSPPSASATVQSIVFDAAGNMIVGLRAAPMVAPGFGQFVAPQSGKVLRFAKAGDGTSGGAWSTESQEYAIGAGPSQAGGSGGLTLAHGYNADGTIDVTRCDATLAATGDGLSQPDSDDAAIHGVQLNAVDLVRPANTPTPTQSAFLDFDTHPGNKESLGSVGAVAAIQRCAPGAAQSPEIAGAPGAGAPGESAGSAATDPSAPNMAVAKTRTCQQTGETLDCTFSITATNTGASPFALSGASFEDNFSTPPETLSVEGGGDVKTATGFQIPVPENTVVAVGSQAPALTVSATFKVPPGGLTIENCASLVPAAIDPTGDAAAGADNAGAASPPNLTPEQAQQLGLSPEEAQTLAGGQLVFVKAPPTGNCVSGEDGLKRCTWALSLNNFSKKDNVNFTAATSVAPSEFSAGLPTNNFDIENPPKAGSTDKGFAVRAVVGSSETATVSGTFPGNQPDPTISISISQAEQAKAKAAGVAPIDPNGGAGQAASTDSNAGDNTSCVTFDTNNPQDPGTPTNEPTLPPPDDTAQNDPNDGGGGTGAGETPPEPLPGAGNLSIAKSFSTCRQLPNGTSAMCDFSITVTNTGNEPVPLAGVSTLTDKFSVKPKEMSLLGTDIDGAILTPDGFVSNADGQAMIPPGSLPPLPVRATFDVPPEGLVGENCAELSFAAPGTEVPPVFSSTVADSLQDAGPLPPAAVSSKLDRGVKLEGEPSCVARGPVKDCTWTVRVENPGDDPFPLEFEFETQVDNARVVSASGLTPGRRTGRRTEFESQIPVPPKTARSVKVTATVPNDGNPVVATVKTKDSILTAAPTFEVDKNSANDRATATAGTGPVAELAGTETFKGDSNAGDNKACVAFSASPKGNEPTVNLDIVKKPGTCGKNEERSEWICAFEVELTNKSDKPFTQAITLSDVTNFKTETTITNDATKFKCDLTGGAKTTTACNIVAATIPAGESTTFSIDSRVPFDAVPIETAPGDCVLRNTIAITSPRGLGSQESTAIATLDPGPNRGKAIPCDPPALELTKTAQDCTPAGDGFDCKFQLAIKSVGQDPFVQGDINIFEQLPDNATIKSHSTGWSCPGVGFVHCTFKNATLQVNETKTLDLVVSVPKSSVKSGQCEISNTARLVELGRPQGTVPAAFVATAAAKIDSPECAPKCPPGQPVGRDGSCDAAPARVCAAGWQGEYPKCCPIPQRFDDATRKCTAPPSPPPVACVGGGMVYVASTGICDCPSGQTFDPRRGRNGQCYTRTAIPKPEIRGGSTSTVYTPPPIVRDPPPAVRYPPPVVRDPPPVVYTPPPIVYNDPPRCPRNYYPVRHGRQFRCHPYPNQDSGPKGGTNGTTAGVSPPRCPDGYYLLRRGTRAKCFPKQGGPNGGTNNVQTTQTPCPPGSYPRWRGNRFRCYQTGPKTGPDVVQNEPRRCGPNEYRIRRGTRVICLPKRGGSQGQQNDGRIAAPHCPRSHYPVRIGRGWRCVPRSGGGGGPDRHNQNALRNWQQQQMMESRRRRWEAMRNNYGSNSNRRNDWRQRMRGMQGSGGRIRYGGSSGSSNQGAPVR